MADDTIDPDTTEMLSLLQDIARAWIAAGAVDIIPVPNGVTYMGVDEGEVIGSRVIAEWAEKLEAYI